LRSTKARHRPMEKSLFPAYLRVCEHFKEASNAVIELARPGRVKAIFKMACKQKTR